MKKMVILSVFVVFCATTLTAQNFRDGLYFAQEVNRGVPTWTNNQRNQVVIQVSGGRIASVNFNVLFLAHGQRDLKSMAQEPDALPALRALAGQLAAVEAHIVSTQRTANATVAGGPDNTKDLLSLANTAVSARGAQPVARGAYSRDGWFFAMYDGEVSEQLNWRTRNYVIITVVNGTIVDAFWNGILEGYPSSINRSKMIQSRGAAPNNYPMSDPPPAGVARVAPRTGNRWDQQAERVAAELVRLQNPALIRVRPDGYTDAISGVSISVGYFVNLAGQALP